MADLASCLRSRGFNVMQRVTLLLFLCSLAQPAAAVGILGIDRGRYLAPNENVGTIERSDAAHPLGKGFVLVDAGGRATHRVQEVPGIDLNRYLGRDVVIHGSSGVTPGPHRVPWIHPWRIDVSAQPARAAAVQPPAMRRAVAEEQARLQVIPTAAAAAPAARPAPNMRGLLELAFADDLRPAAQAEEPAAVATVRTAQHVEGEWAVPPPQMHQREIVIPDSMGPEFGGGPGYGDCAGCGQPGAMDWGPRRGGCEPPPSPQWSAAFEATFLEPRFSNNPAYTSIDSSGGNLAFVQRDFSYDMEFAPRLWAAWSAGDGGGLRGQYWKFDQAAAPESASPPSPGSLVSAFFPNANVFIQTSNAGDVLTVNSDINAYVIDLEAIQRVEMKYWRAVLSAGVRYGSITQTYQAVLRDDDEDIQQQIDYSQSFKGFGPTVSLMAARPIYGGLEVFGIARGSILFGDGRSSLVSNSFGSEFNQQVTEVTNHSDILPIGELQFGFSYTGSRWEIFHPFVRAALEAQIWHNAGSASSQDADLGFAGFTGTAGVTF